MPTPFDRPLSVLAALFSADSRFDNAARLVGLRTVAIFGQLLAVALAYFVLKIDLPLTPILSVVVALTVFNLYCMRLIREGRELDEERLLLFLSIDIVALTVLLFYSGGSENPFIGQYLLLLAVGAVVLPSAYVVALLFVSLTGFVFLHFFRVPLAWPGNLKFERETYLAAGAWVSFLLAAGLIGLLVMRMTATLRERDQQLALERESKLRNQQIVALGTLATGALHELGTPLSTIKMLVTEMLETGQRDAQVDADLRLIEKQVDACKETLSKLAAQSGAARGERARALSLARWLEQTIAKCRALQPRADIQYIPDPSLDDIEVVADETLSQALLNLLNNAAQFSPQRIDVGAFCDEHELNVEIRDFGPGITSVMATHAGRAFQTTRQDGMGLGLFLAHAVVERFQGRIALNNHPRGGLLTIMTIPLAGWRT